MNCEDFETESPKRGRIKSVALVAAVLAVVVFGGLALAVILRDPPDPSFDAGREDEGSFPLDAKEQVTAALEVWQQFIESASLEERAAFVRDPERVLPLMEDYYSKRGHPFPSMNRISPGRSVTIGHRVMVFFEVEPFRGPVYPVAVEWEDGRFAVDWESLEAYGTMDWNEFVERKPTSGQILRVYLSKLPERWQPVRGEGMRRVFQMEHRDDGMSSVVVQVDGDLAIRIEELVRGKRVPLTAEVKWVEGAGSFEINRLVSEGWSE